MLISKIQKTLQQKVLTVIFVQGLDVNEYPTFAYVAVEGHNVEHFMRAYNNNSFNPSSYGTVLCCGHGMPNQVIKDHMESTYGFNHKDAVGDSHL